VAQIYGAALATPHSRLGRLTICNAPGFAGGCLLAAAAFRHDSQPDVLYWALVPAPRAGAGATGKDT
jgi:hypothetical protein